MCHRVWCGLTEREVPAFARIMWRQQLKAKQCKGVEKTMDPVVLYIIASRKAPFGVAMKGKVNQALLDIVKKIKSPADGFTYVFSWYKHGSMWAHIRAKDSPGFCTLRELLQEGSDFIETVWNDAQLVEKVVFLQDSVNGAEITEEVAIELNDQFDPDDDDEAPATSQASRRRVFDAPGPTGSKRARRIWYARPLPHQGSIKFGQQKDRQHAAPGCTCAGAFCLMHALSRYRPELTAKVVKRMAAAYAVYVMDWISFNPSLSPADLPLSNWKLFADSCSINNKGEVFWGTR